MTRLETIVIPRLPPMPRIPYVAQVDVRVALGVNPIPGAPGVTCYFCWPALVASVLWDHNGEACCARCAANAKRVRQLPLFRPSMFAECARRSA